jgi:hypothetical protein
MAIVPVHQGESGPKVAALHEGLLYLIRHQRNLVKQTRVALASQLEHDADSFGTATASIVGIFQYQIRNRKNLPKPVKDRFATIPLLRVDAATGNGDVDDLTAEALNWLVRETRALRRQSPKPD